MMAEMTTLPEPPYIILGCGYTGTRLAQALRADGVGTVLGGIFNFRPDPTVLQVVAWVSYVVVVLSLFLRPVRNPVSPAEPGASI